MKKQVIYSEKMAPQRMDGYDVFHLLPNDFVSAVGPFVTADYTIVNKHTDDKGCHLPEHPHKGLTTLTYVLDGEALHRDSLGNCGRVQSGGVHWLKAGSGIVHEETIVVSSDPGKWVSHVFHFSILLPSQQKNEIPDHRSWQAFEMPKVSLENGSGWIKVLLGSYGRLKAAIPSHQPQFLYHLQLAGTKRFTLDTQAGWQYAALVPFGNIIINENQHEPGELLVFDESNDAIGLEAATEYAEIIFFGGAIPAESFVADGPFALNTEHEITEAYNDYYKGKYGYINKDKACKERQHH